MMMEAIMRVIPLLLSTLILVTSRVAAEPAYIGASFSEDGSMCDATLVAPVSFTVYIHAYPVDVLGIDGAEFRVEGFDPAWMTTVRPNPLANVVIGNPIQAGCNIAFAQCQGQGSGFRRVLLFTIQVVAMNPITPRQLIVRAHTTPSHPLWPCPNVVPWCGAPVYGRVCTSTLNACLNRDQTCCITAVEATTWARMKSLYER
jgi:hypothetical protein